MSRIYHFANNMDAIKLWDKESFSLESTLTYLDLKAEASDDMDDIDRKAREQLAKLLASVKLIKLHGSLNWLFCKNCSSLLCYLKAKAEETHYTEIIEWCPYCHSSDVEYVLIPPILRKTYRQPGISRIWDAARGTIWSC